MRGDSFRQPKPDGRRSPVSTLGHAAMLAAGAAFSLAGLSACAVGPDFAPPTLPAVAGYTPERTPAATTSADVPGGSAQKFDIGRDIPGDWWKVFRSKELDALIAEALRANPN